MGWRSSAIVVIGLGGCAFRPDGAIDAGDVGVPIDGRGSGDDDAAEAASCPPGYVAGTAGVYRLVEGGATWDAARADCADDAAGGAFTLHTHLVVLASDAERESIRSDFGGPRLWLGVSDRVTTFAWRWVTAEEIEAYPPGSGPPWRVGQPTNGDSGAQDCVVMEENGLWDDRPCNSDAYAYVCECDAFPEEPAHF
ncbi:MAG: C-type lectin domain-containing protein [Deltaproteobacteria bacterium]|nr:C-type lectin domain-containing protein [Kofleriaceae bacterium]